MKKLVPLLLLLTIGMLNAQKKNITGIVSDKEEPLPGASIVVKGTSNGTNTDIDGKYSIKAQEGDILVFSYLGFETVEKTVGDVTEINVVMKESSSALDEVVIRGRTAGVKITTVGASSKVVIRGMSSMKASKATKSKRNLPQSGQLTAGEIDDLKKWREWKSLYNRADFKKVENEWELELGEKLDVFITDDSKKPINGAKVYFIDESNNVTLGKSDHEGKVTFFKNKDQYFTIQVVHDDQIKGLKITKNYSELFFEFKSDERSKELDVMFTVDATGSMADEINYLKAELENIITRLDSSISKKRLGLLFYRDEGDDYVTKSFEFTSDIKKVKENLLLQNAMGGGDYEEAVDRALKESLMMSWSPTSDTKLMFLLLDAPPHLNQENVYTIKEQIKKAKELGVKIIPVVASGADKNVEYLMRYFSVYTNGTYVFLTDDSGIGNKHLKPSAEDYKVEKLNDLIVRLINKYSGV